jgi:hypothetical protein
MAGLSAFSWGYEGWGNAVPQLLESTASAEKRRGFERPFFVDVRFRRSVRAAGFRDKSFERLAGSSNQVWMPKLGNKNILTGEDMALADPVAATGLLELIQELYVERRRVIFFCACKAPAAPDECHRWLVTRELLARTKTSGIELTVEEWPGGKPSGGIDLRTTGDEAANRALRANRKWIPLPSTLSQDVAASLPWGSVIQLSSAGEEYFVVTGPSHFRAGRWVLPAFSWTTEESGVEELVAEAPFVRGERSDSDELLLSARRRARAALPGPGIALARTRGARSRAEGWRR